MPRSTMVDASAGVDAALERTIAVHADANATIERTIAAHRRAIDRYIVLDWRDREALERECLRIAVRDQVALRAAMVSA